MRRFIYLLLAALCLPVSTARSDGPHLASGIKIGEVTQNSAIVWARLTVDREGDPRSPDQAAPGEEGYVSVSYESKAAGDGPKLVGPHPVNPDADFTIQIPLSGLHPGADYELTVYGHDEEGSLTASLDGRFRTPPSPETIARVRGVIVTCQGIGTTDHPEKGHRIYDDMLKAGPDFFVHTGDVVYYDNDEGGLQPLSKNATMARQRWNRMFAFEWNQEFHRHVSSYYLKDDHDTLKNDCWPGQTFGELTFDQGLAIFREQVPSSPLPYRTFRWGRDLQIWLLEGRDYRTPNPEPDGPEKTLLGADQKAWLKKTVAESDATFRLIISPSPIVGPDKKGKADNLANAVYQAEGDEIREFLSGYKNLFVVCGDRHWQYASQDPVTGLLEFGCGPVNGKHAQRGGNSGEREQHLYFGGGKGGFLEVEVDRIEGDLPQIRFTWLDADRRNENGDPQVNHERSYPAKPNKP
jgi:alkaline phosphatase D